MSPIHLAKCVLLLGLSSWMTVAVFNNATDPSTNHFFLGTMLDMHLLANDPNELGVGLRWRAWSASQAPLLLSLIIGVEVLISAYLWKGGISLTVAVIRQDEYGIEKARVTAVRSLVSFMALWLTFLVGGLWFGYWIKQGAVQQVHITPLILSTISIAFVASGMSEASNHPRTKYDEAPPH